LVNAATTLYPSVFAALDTNNDRVVDARDAQCRLVLMGYSWGGVSSVEVASTLAADTRVAASLRSVDVLLAFDPYQRGLAGPPATLDVPANVRRFHEFRHSITPAQDCSSSAPFGPYKGIAPRCRVTSMCFDYDYSLAPMTSFASYLGGSYLGSRIGHCEVPAVVHGQARQLLFGQPLTGTPPTRVVPVIP
jgi:hypothetical protein